MSVTRISELRRENYALHKSMAALLEKGDEKDSSNKRKGLSTEQSAEWDKMDAEYETRKAEIAMLEKQADRESKLKELDAARAGREPTPGGDPPTPEQKVRAAHGSALRAFLSESPTNWSEETRQAVALSQKEAPAEARGMGHCFTLMGPRPFRKVRRGSEIEKLKEELRFLGIVTAGKGQETVPEDFMAELDTAMLDFSGILQTARTITTATGAAMPWPKVDDTTQIGELLAEDATAAEADPAFTGVTFDAFVYSSKAVRVANTLLQDSAFNLESEIARMLGIRLGRIMNLHGTTGTGSSQPRGVVTAVVAETTPVSAASPTAVAYVDLVDLQHAVDPAYRPQSVFMMHDTTVKAIKKLLDGDLRPLWSSGIAVREPDTILGHRWFVNQDMDADPPAAAEESILFGDFSKYVIRRVINPVIVRLNELFALEFQTGFVMFDRWDSDLVDAGTGPIQVLQH